MGKLSIALLTVVFTASLGFADSASAAKKLTYNQAWAVCKAKMDKAEVPGTGSPGERTLHPRRELHETTRL